MVSPTDYLILTVVHRNNEDWYLRLPLEIEESELVGATVSCAMENRARQRIEIPCSFDGLDIVMSAQSEVFEDHVGLYSGEVLLTLSGGRDFVTHLFNTDFKRGIARRA